MTAARAQEGAVERDPFYPSAARPSVTAPPPGGTDEGPWGRDPFDNPLAGKATMQKGPLSPGQDRALTGIIYSRNVRVAIFGGESYQEGSMVGDRKLVDIRRRSVVFMIAGVKEEVFLGDFTMNK